MTEAEWLACADPWPMLAVLPEQVSDRKVRLFAVFCCQGLRGLLEPRSLSALAAAERYADGLCKEADLRAADSAALDALNDNLSDQDRQAAAMAVCWTCDKNIRLQCPSITGQTATVMARQHPPHLMEETERLAKLDRARALRDIVGNPFRRGPFYPWWRTADAVGLARGIYEDRAFDRLPILADALTDAGCDNEGMLAHLRNDEPHVRGCWVVDRVLGKE
jgi:hypothetical protein